MNLYAEKTILLPGRYTDAKTGVTEEGEANAKVTVVFSYDDEFRQTYIEHIHATIKDDTVDEDGIEVDENNLHSRLGKHGFDNLVSDLALNAR